MDFLSIMAPPFAACLVLMGIHTYLGVHVLAREVIFVDLALAQVAALGAAVALVIGLEAGSTAAYTLSLAFALLGAGLFTATRTRRHDVSQEAVIGIAYAVAAAATILVMDRLPHGAEEIKALLVGSILWVSWGKVLATAALYAVIGALHWVWRERFLTISYDPEEASRRGYRIRLWDFLFYATFAVVVTRSVHIAGVLLVFCFLIVPAVGASLFTRDLRSRLLLGWLMGTVVSMVGCALSYLWDLPTGATVVCTFGAALAALTLIRVSCHGGMTPDSHS
ncbi:metal ABC transporter permease [Candidatus Poribacteria bacterium]|nr:metal ABC transporter permease [Candidatus Poribacteria bacterium]